MWNIQEFCKSQTPLDLDSIPSESSKAFLEALHLPGIHPFCNQEAYQPYEIPGVPPQGPLLHNEHIESIQDVLWTLVAMAVPAFTALTELWLRLFAFFLAPIGTIHILSQISKSPKPTTSTLQPWIRVIIVSSTIVWMTDTLYVLEFGHYYGLGMFCVSSVASLWLQLQQPSSRRVLPVLLVLFVVATALVWDTHNAQWTFGHPDDHVDHLQPGLYYHTSNQVLKQTVEAWDSSFYSYDDQATPWMPTGDSRTGLPFLFNKVHQPTWHRVWLQVDDGEVVALDISFPDTGYDPSRPVFLVLHGLNGGSQEEYIKDLAHRRHQTGCTLIVMIARGLMDLPVRGWNIFHGARWTDAHAAASAIKRVLAPNQTLAGVGYSMGGIILNNYVARSGAGCALNVAVSLSGGLDMRFQEDYYRAQRLWQPLITTELRDTLVMGKFGERVRSRLSKDDLKKLMRATHVTDVDKAAVVVYNGFRNVQHYYSEMSALGDIPLDEYNQHKLGTARRINNVSIPLLVVHALDDPLITFRTVTANQGLLHPTNITKEANGNLLILLTKRGGHVGWPTGILPFQNNWKWMSEVSSSFVDAYIDTKSTPL